MLKDLFISKTRVKILETLLSDPTQMYHVRDLVRKTGDEINAVRRELIRMDELGMVKKEPRGNRVYYWFRKDYVFYQDLLSLVSKTTGLGGAIIKNKNKIGKLHAVMISGRFLKRIPKKNPDEVDLFVVGDVNLNELNAIIHEEEVTRGVSINFTPMTEEELKYRRSRKDPFIISILSGTRIMIFGSEEDITG